MQIDNPPLRFISEVFSAAWVIQFLHNNKRKGKITHEPEPCVQWKARVGIYRNACTTQNVPLQTRQAGKEKRNNETSRGLNTITYPSPNWDSCKLQVLPFRTGTVGLTRSIHALYTSLFSWRFKCHHTSPNSPFVHDDWTFTRSAPSWSSVTFSYVQKKTNAETNCSSAPASLTVRAAEWRPTETPSHPLARRAHPVLAPDATHVGEL